jgi:aminoglycoside phosphotransferase (APT) family kinase protein
VDRFQSKYFKILPKKSEILLKFSKLEIGTIKNIFLFKHSSCSAVFCVEAIDKNNKEFKFVIRGEEQNATILTPESTHSLEKEISVFKKMKVLGLNVPEILFNSKIFSVPGYDESGIFVKNFRFFLMTYIEGIAVDKKIQSVSDDEKLFWLKKISGMMVKIHATKGKEYGFIDQYNNASFKTNNIHGFLNELNSITKLLEENIGDLFAKRVKIFMEDKIKSLSKEFKSSGYLPQISLSLFDGSAGNMLIKDRDIQVLDFTCVGYFEPIIDFCAHFFCMKDILSSEYKGKKFYEYFIDFYKIQGGKLPPEPFLSQLFHIVIVYFLCFSIVYYKTHLSLDKQKQTNEIMKVTDRVINLKSPNMFDIVNKL